MAVQKLVTEVAGMRRQPAPQVDAQGRIYKAPAPRESTVLGFAGDIVVGAAQGVGDMVGGVFNLIFHPIQTIKGLVMLPITLITRPGDLVRAFTEPYSQAIASGHAGRAIGRGIVEIGSIIFGPKLIGKGIDAVKGATAAGKAGGAAGAASKVTELGAKAGKVAETAEKASKVANAAEKAGKAGKAAEVASTAAKVAEGVAGGQKITVVVGTEVGKAAKAAKVAGKAKKLADAASRASKAAKSASAAETARKAANAAKAARRADAARKAAEAAAAAQKIEEAARVASAAEKAAEAAKAASKAASAANRASKAGKAATRAGRVARTASKGTKVARTAAKAGKVSRTAKAAKFVKGTTATKSTATAARASRTAKVTAAVKSSPEVLLRETRRVRMWGNQKVVNLPGKGSLRITNFSYESVREVRYMNAAAGSAAKAGSKVAKAGAKAGAKAAKAAKKVPVKVPNLKVAKPFASASKKMGERAAALKATGNLAEARRLETLSAKLEAAGKVYAKGDKAKGLAMFRESLNKKGTQEALRLSNKADEVLAAFGKPGGEVFKRSQVVAEAAGKATRTGKTVARGARVSRAKAAAKASRATRVRAPKTPAVTVPAHAGAVNGTGLSRAAARVDGWFKNVRAEFGRMGQMKVAQLPGHIWGLTTGFAKDL
ncbi:MAG: hypothetical protein FJZ00_06265, partial [Candidatus Sericytochromatia bacterium]|nr:hypothetical protein [Candidatus Tanganyikabacteria bacterium]